MKVPFLDLKAQYKTIKDEVLPETGALILRILLVNPPNSGRSIPEERYGIESIKEIFRGEPLALEVLAGALPGRDVRILDRLFSTEHVRQS